MLRLILDAHGGTLPDGVNACFQNTGKERPETLDFVEECSQRWGVRIVWLERSPDGIVVVDHATASRDGAPFTAWTRKRNFLPNQQARFCTVEMKVYAQRDFMRLLGHGDEWTNVVGLRADEMNRVVRARSNRRDWDSVCPLASAGVVKADVEAFWKTQPFDLRLKAWEGNCDLCFLKGMAKRTRIMRDRPDLAQWWIDRENEISLTTTSANGARFRADTPDFASLLAWAQQPRLFDEDSDPTNAVDCSCTD